jgi:hypothetical protein
MEVHHHSHSSRKKWTHYFWEFLMLFLAVFCGFLAEYQLEHKIEKEREQEYIRSLVEDLKSDTNLIRQHIIAQQFTIKLMDSLIFFLNNPELIKSNGGSVYYIARVAPRSVTFASNNKTFEQLKHAGGFRLIRNSEASNRIMAYYNTIPFLHQLEDIFNGEFTEYKRAAARLFDPSVFRKMENGADGSIKRTDENPQLVNTSPVLLKELGIFSVYLNGTRRGMLQLLPELQTKSSELINYLKKEYHLK